MWLRIAWYFEKGCTIFYVANVLFLFHIIATMTHLSVLCNLIKYSCFISFVKAGARGPAQAAVARARGGAAASLRPQNHIQTLKKCSIRHILV